MQFTSFFIGLKVEPVYFIKLFVDLQSYLKEEKIENSITIQNINSIHFSLYYLSNEYVFKNYGSIREEVLDKNKEVGSIAYKINSYKFFQKDGMKLICYLFPEEKEILTSLNNYFSKYSQLDILENTYTYIPHMTLFKIEDYKLYDFHSKNIDSILKKNLEEIEKQRFFLDLNLYGVNSNYIPEIQIPININLGSTL